MGEGDVWTLWGWGWWGLALPSLPVKTVFVDQSYTHV